jgi:predicted lipid-binding transport protein (Tim44 family)
MTDDPVPEDPQAAEPEPKKGRGCFLGGLATVGALIGGAILGGIIAGVAGAAGAAAVPVLAIALMIGAGFYWRETPGFVIGIGLTIGISLAIGTACTTLFLV